MSFSGHGHISQRCTVEVHPNCHKLSTSLRKRSISPAGGVNLKSTMDVSASASKRLMQLPVEEWGNCPYCFTAGVIGLPCMECYPEGWTDEELQPYEKHLRTDFIHIPFALFDPRRGEVPHRMCPFRLAHLMRDVAKPHDGLITRYGHMLESQRWQQDQRSKARGLTISELRERTPCTDKYFHRFLSEYDNVIQMFRYCE